MRDRDPFDVTRFLGSWNVALAAFSLVGSVRTVPHLLFNLIQFDRPQSTSLCSDPMSDWGSSATGVWVLLFVISKIPELFDTWFIVVRKKPLLFLHWYHHVTVMLFCWHAYATMARNALYFIAMNYSVHAVMYTYFAMMAFRVKPRWFNSNWITIAQILQMIVGTCVQVASFVLLWTKPDCPLDASNVFAGGVMYASYFALFVWFFTQRWKKRRKQA